MPVGIMQPSGQVKLTNVAYVRMRKGKKRYEIACYKNKILEYRQKIETNWENVLQADEVYVNVGTGEKASNADLERDFGIKFTKKEHKEQKKKIVDEILLLGDFQVGEEERKAQLDRIHHEVVNIVASKVVNPNTKRVYTADHIEKMLNHLSSQAAQHQQQQQQQQQAAKAEAAIAPENGEDKEKRKQAPWWRGVTAKKEAKEQAGWAIKALVASNPTEYAKARMRLRVFCPTSMLKHTVKRASQAQTSDDGASAATKTKDSLRDTITAQFEHHEDPVTTGDEWEVTGFAEPGSLKTLHKLLEQTKGRGRVDFLDMAMIHVDD